MSEEKKTNLQNLIDKVIGKKGIFKAPAWWVHNIFSSIKSKVDAIQENLDNISSTVTDNTKSFQNFIEQLPYVDIVTTDDSEDSDIVVDTTNVTIKGHGEKTRVPFIQGLLLSNNSCIRQLHFPTSGLYYCSLHNQGFQNMPNLEDIYHLETILDPDTVCKESRINYFRYCNKLYTPTGILLTTETNLSSMFAGCKTFYNSPDMNTSKVTNMDHMFQDCSNLIRIQYYNTSNVKNMDFMFDGCTSFLDDNYMLSKLNLKSLESMNHMFYGCSKIININLGVSFGTQVSMNYAFSGCSKLQSIKLPNIVVKSSIQAFSNNPALTTLRVGELSFKDSTTINIHDLFAKDTKLTNVVGNITGIRKSFLLKDCPLTVDSAMVFINGLSEVSDSKNITFKKSTYDQLTEDQIAVATSKGWTVVSSST